MDRREEAVIPSLLPTVLVLISSLLAQAPACTATGDLEIVPFESSVFPAPRQLRILVPTGYRLAANSSRRYPVLYLNDGQTSTDSSSRRSPIRKASDIRNFCWTK